LAVADRPSVGHALPAIASDLGEIDARLGGGSYLIANTIAARSWTLGDHFRPAFH